MLKRWTEQKLGSFGGVSSWKCFFVLRVDQGSMSPHATCFPGSWQTLTPAEGEQEVQFLWADVQVAQGGPGGLRLGIWGSLLALFQTKWPSVDKTPVSDWILMYDVAGGRSWVFMKVKVFGCQPSGRRNHWTPKSSLEHQLSLGSETVSWACCVKARKTRLCLSTKSKCIQ